MHSRSLELSSRARHHHSARRLLTRLDCMHMRTLDVSSFVFVSSRSARWWLPRLCRLGRRATCTEVVLLLFHGGVECGLQHTQGKKHTLQLPAPLRQGAEPAGSRLL